MICFIVPYRDRLEHLQIFIPRIKQKFKNPDICFVEQLDNKPFNRGALLNIGFALHGFNFSYAAYHDIDMIPTKADYSYPLVPTHLATKVQQFKMQMPYPDYFGGVVLFNKEDFEKCGGYSNHFWGWGGEDDELRNHLTAIGMRIERRTGYYESLYHEKSYNGLFDPQKALQAKQPRKENDGYKFIRCAVDRVETISGCTKIGVYLD